MVDYKQLLNLKLPRTKKTCSPKRDLFPVEVIAEEDCRVRVRYIGYGEEYDEWKDKDEIQIINAEDPPPNNNDSIVLENIAGYQPFSLYKELRLRIKCGLSCSRTGSPCVKISMSFDVLQFNGGLKCAGIPSEKKSGIRHYKLRNYADLNDLLGRDWHFRGINANGDYGYVLLDTVDFYLVKSRSFVEYIPSVMKDDTFKSVRLKTDTGYSLVFTFVCDYGTDSTFGKDKKNFV